MKWIKKLLENAIESAQLERANIMHVQHKNAALVGYKYFDSYSYAVSTLHLDILKLKISFLKSFIGE